jgi:hypothetical protein
MQSYTCTEYINVGNLDNMLSDDLISDDERKKLRKLKSSLKKKNHHTVVFAPSNTVSGSNKVGRLYPKTQSLQNLQRNIRKALAYDNYIDVDMVNAHPEICRQLFERNEIKCPLLTQYCSNRDALLNETGLTRDEAKKQFMKILYGGDDVDYTPKFSTPFMTNFFKEQIENSKRLMNIPEYLLYKKLGETNTCNTDKSALASGINLLCSDYERQCITSIINYFKANDFETGTIIHDGFLLKAQHVKPEMLIDVIRRIKLQNNFDMVVKVKSLNDFNASDLWNNDTTDPDLEESDHTYALTFIEYMKDKGHRFVSSVNVIYWYDPTCGYYVQLVKLTGLRTLMASCADIPHNVRGSSSRQGHILTQFTDIVCSTVSDEDFSSKVYETTKGKMNFQNGIYDFDKKQLVPHTPDVYFLGKLQHDFSDTNQLLENEIYEKLFVGVYGELKSKYLLSSLARGFAGQVCDKTVNFIIGKGNTGKGVLTDMMKACGAFAGNINDADLCKKSTNNSSALNLSWMLRIKDARFAIMNETSQGISFDHASLKKFCSGGDVITARKNYENEQEFHAQFTGFLFMNDLPKIDDCDEATRRRIKVIEPMYRFYEGKEYEQRKNETGVKKADISLRDVFVKRADVKQAFLSLLCKAYEQHKPDVPDVISKASEEWTAGDDVECTLKNIIEHTKNHTDKLQCNAIKAVLNEMNIHVSNVRIGRYLRELIGDENKKCSNGKTYYHTVRLRTDDDDDEIDND